MMLKRVVVIGSGNVAESLAGAIAAVPELELVQLYARNEERGRTVATMAHTTWCNRPEALAEADIYLFAVSDRAVEPLAESLPIPLDAVVAHTAGAVSIEALRRFPRRAILYPFQGFSAGRKVDFRAVPLFLETADAGLMPTLEAFAACLSEHIYHADSERRAHIHLAGVFCNNFSNAMYGMAEEILQQVDLPFEVLKPLIRETAEKALVAPSPRTVQTGPARRGDLATQQKHLQLIQNDRQRTIYELISQTIWETSKKI